MKRIIVYILSVTLVSCVSVGRRPSIAKSSESGTETVVTGKPARPTPIAVGSSSIEYSCFKVSYNAAGKIPNWVLYELTASETEGPYSRKGKDFQADPGLSLPQANDGDYRRSGWSRGHMAPAADFKWSDRAMTETFYYTNICPQNSTLNQKYWNTLEKKVRKCAMEFGKVWVVTGPVVGGNVYGTIGAGKVVVPDALFKAMLAQVGGRWVSLGFIMSNNADVQTMKSSAVTVNEIELQTGQDLFDFLPDDIEEQVESQLDYKFWKIY